MSKILENDKINIGLLMFKVRKLWYVFALIIPLVLINSYFYTKSLQRVYGFKAVVLMSSKHTGSARLDELLNIAKKMDRKVNTDDEIGIITSYDMIEKTLEHLDFGVSYYTGKDFRKNEKYGNFPVKVTLESEKRQMLNIPIYIEILSDKEYILKIKEEEVDIYDWEEEATVATLPKVRLKEKIKFNEVFRHENLNIKVELVGDPKKFGNSKLYFVINHPTSVVKKYKRKLKVEPAKRDSYLLELRTTGSLAQKEIVFMNKLMEVVIEEDLIEKNRQGQKALTFIEEQLGEAERDLVQASAKVESFESSNSLMDIENQSRLATEDLGKFLEQKANLELKLKNYQNLYHYLRIHSKTNLTSVPTNYSITDGTISHLLYDLFALNKEKAAKMTNETENSPGMLRINEQIENILITLKRYLEQNITASENSLNKIYGKISAIDVKRTKLPLENSKLKEFYRDLDFNINKYQNLLQKKNEAKLGLTTNTSDIRIIEEAKKEKDAPIKPNTKFIYLLSLMLGAGLPLAFIVMEDIFNNTIQNKEDLKAISKIPFLAMIVYGGKKFRIISKNTNLFLYESFKVLRLNIENLRPVHKKQCLGVTSTVGKEGKTFCASNLAINYALSGKRTILLEGDMFKNQIGTLFGLEDAKGVTEYIQEQAEIREIIHTTNYDTLDIIVAGKSLGGNLPELLDTSRFVFLMEYLKQNYDKIILDIPPIGLISDYFLLKDHIDMTLYVTCYNQTSKNLLDEINEMYETGRVQNVYFILNRVKYSSMYEFQFKEKKHPYYSIK